MSDSKCKNCGSRDIEESSSYTDSGYVYYILCNKCMHIEIEQDVREKETKPERPEWESDPDFWKE